MKRKLTAGTVLCLVLTATLPGQAQRYRDFTIGRGFTPDPQTGTGHAGGPQDASRRFGSDCRGSVDRTPDHVITVTSAVNLRLYAESSSDSTLVLRGPSGTYCDDDSHGGLHPEINAVLSPGRYEVWVGNYDEGVGDRYVLTLTENPGGVGTDGGDESYGATFTIGGAFTPDPQRTHGTAGGSVSASSVGRGCVGSVSLTPDHIIVVTSTVAVRLVAQSGIDTTLLLRGPAGTFCDDDSAGNLDPLIDAVLTPGRYDVWVGNHRSAVDGRYTLTLTENIGR